MHLRVASWLDQDARARLPLGTLWNELASGSSRVVMSFQTKHRCFLILRPTARGDALLQRGLRPRNVELLQRTLLTRCRKALAQELGVSESTLAQSAAESLQAMGLALPPSRAPILLVIAAHQHYHRETSEEARLRMLQLGPVTHTVLSVARPEEGLSGRLSNAEYAVVRRVVEGKSNEEIAALRRASPRTIANQINAIFRKLGVSGRSDLINCLASPLERIDLARNPKKSGSPGARRLRPNNLFQESRRGVH
jgi:DNA-binding CsgD family transcriptional regulator